MRRLVIVCALLATGCGGGARQDASEPSGDFKVEVVRASFPRTQHIAQAVALRLRVRNADQRPLRDLAVTVETTPKPGSAGVAFGSHVQGDDLGDSTRPIWVLDRGPRGGDTAYDNTWTSGPLRAGESRELTWQLVATRAGSYTVTYKVAPGLTGRTHAAGGRTSGSFKVTIDDQPVPARVGDKGQVIRGTQ